MGMKTDKYRSSEDKELLRKKIFYWLEIALVLLIVFAISTIHYRLPTLQQIRRVVMEVSLITLENRLDRVPNFTWIFGIRKVQ